MIKNNLKLCCVYGKYDTEPKIVTPESVEYLLKSEKVRKNFDLYRKTENEEYKLKLPAVLFNGVYDHEAYKADRAAGSTESARNDKYFLPSPFIGLDIDLDGAKELFEQVKEKVKSKLGCDFTEKILMAYETPSGRLRVIALRRMGTSIAEDRAYWEGIIELPCDPKCVNTSRLFFLTPKEYLFHIDSEKIFSYLANHDPNDYKSEEKVEIEKAPATHASTGNKQVSSYFAPKFGKEDLISIAKELEFVHSGGPALEGGRNNMTFDLAKYLRYLTGDDVELLAEIIPQYEVTEVAHKAAIKNAVKYCKKAPYIPLVLQRAIDRAIYFGTEEVNPQEEGVDLPPAMPKYLPESVSCFIANTPEMSRPAVAMAVFAALRCLMRGVEFVYIDNKAKEPCFMSLTIAEQSIGKGAFGDIKDVILHKVQKEDDVSRQEDEDWRTAASVMGDSFKEAPPKSPIRIIQADATNAALVQLAKRSNGYSLFTYAEEIDKMWKMLDFSEVARSAFDSEVYGQERVGAGSVSGVPQLRWSTIMATTPGTAYNKLYNETNNGLLTRLTLSTIIRKEDDWGEETPMYGDYNDDYKRAVEEFTVHLTQVPAGKFYCQNALDWAKAEKLRQIDKFKLMDAKYMLPYLWRSLLMAFWRGCMLYIMNGNQWSEEIEDFITWTLNYDLWCKMHYFGDVIEVNTKKDEGTRRDPRSLLPLLEDSFTKEDAVVMRQRVGKSIAAKDVRFMLNTWKHRGFIVEDEAGVYHKTNQIPKK